MTSEAVSSLLRMPKRERLELAETLWLSVADEKKLPVPDHHKKILDSRLAELRSGKTKTISQAELLRRLRA